MTSVYAASTIHSKSTLSRKYEVDTSAMWNGGEKFRVKDDSLPNQSTFSNFLQQYSMDVGRFHEVKPWINSIRMFVFTFMLILGSAGIFIVDDTNSELFNAVIHVLQYVIKIIPETSANNIYIIFNLSLILIYAALMFLLFRNLLKYKNGNVPSRNAIYFWIITSRVICPIFSCYISYIFCYYLCSIIGSFSKRGLINLAIAFPLLVMQIAYIFFSCSIYNATPLIRPNDITQLWFSYSYLDRRLNIVLFVLILIQCVLTFFTDPFKEILYFILVDCLAIFFAVQVLYSLPGIAPIYNVIIIFAAVESVPLTFFPLVAHYSDKISPIYFIVCIMLSPIAYFIAKTLVSVRCRKVVDAFANMRELQENEEDDSQQLDPLSAAILNLNKTANIDFLKLNITGDHAISLYLRLGFLFNVPEVEDQSFIKWATDQTVKADLVLSACQVSYALQNDVRMLNTLSVHCAKLSAGPFNSRSFALLFDHLRKELLTQLNEPLLTAVQSCKRSSYILQNFYSEFWGSVLTQRLQNMIDILPQISYEMIRTETLFQNLIRNYPNSTIVYRETVIIYHKVLGEHTKTIEIQSKLNRLKKKGDIDSDRSTSSELDEIDRNFQDQLDPWLAAQNVIENTPSIARKLLIAAATVMIIIMIGLPIVQLCIAIYKINDFLRITEPIEIVGDIQMEVSRIPQLIRRISLYQRNKIKNYTVGPAYGALLEFIDENATRYYLNSYVEDFTDNLTRFLDACTNENIPLEVCNNKTHKMISGNSTTHTTLYNLLSSYLLAAKQLKELHNYSDINKDERFQFIFDNYESAHSGISSALGRLNNLVVSFHSSFNRLCIAFYFHTIVVPLLFVLPIFIMSMIASRKELKFLLRLFFSIPKSDIANLKSSINQKKGRANKNEHITIDDSDAEGAQHRKEELIDNLATVPHSHHGVFMGWREISILFVFFTCVMAFIGISVFQYSMTDIIQMTNAYTYSITVYSHAASCYVWAQELFSNCSIFKNDTETKMKSLMAVNGFQDRFNTLLYGSSQKDTKPGLILGWDISDMYTKSKFIDTSTDVSIPCIGMMHTVYYSLSCEAQVALFCSISQWIFNQNMTYEDEYVYHFEHILFGHIIPFLEEGMVLFENKVLNLNQMKVNDLLIVYILLLVMQIIFICLFLRPSLNLILHHIATPRKLLQLVPPEALMKSKFVAKWISGCVRVCSNISTENRNAMNNEVVEFAVDYSSCGVALCDEFLQIQNANQTFLRMTKMESLNSQESIRQVLLRRLIDRDKLACIERLERVAKKITAGMSKTSIFSFESVIAGANNELQNIVVTLHGYSGLDNNNTFASVHTFAVIIKENNLQHNLEETIKNEREKYNRLLDLFMPKEIRERRIEGTDMSMQVDTGSIIHVTITPQFFGPDIIPIISKIFVTLIQALDHETIKIRTCEMSYVAATGLFTRTKNPGQTASDTALKMLSMVQKVVQNNSVTISIGIHTGSIKCGIIGITNSAFDIVGDTAIAAAKLAESCPPWLVHVSERIYGEIKYLKYNVMEIGNDELGHTYLLSNTSFSQGDHS